MVVTIQVSRKDFGDRIANLLLYINAYGKKLALVAQIIFVKQDIMVFYAANAKMKRIMEIYMACMDLINAKNVIH